MTAERAHAYRRGMGTLTEWGPSKLRAAEQDLIRHAADSLVFSRNLLEDGTAHEALENIERLCRALVDSGRWEHATAMRLADDVSDCGPALLPWLKAA